jgi:TRAP-type C4-dicarboxylate transport system permease small subunit
MSEDPASLPGKRIEEFIFLKIPHFIAGVMFLIAVAINIANVVARYVFATPIFWAEEILVFIVIWTVFVIAGSITYRGAHLNMDLLHSKFSPFWKRVVNSAIAIVLIGSTLFTATQSWKVVRLYIRTGDVTPATGIPLVLPHLALLFGFIFMALAAILRIRAYASGKFD